MADDSSVVKKEDDSLSQEKFDEQTFLIHNYDKFIKKNESTTYENFVQITGEPALVVSKILGTGINEMFNIEPSQLSLLQPKIRLFKVVYTKDGEEKNVELVFNDFFRESSVDDIMKNAGQRGFGIGLKSFEWEDMGTNPGDTGKAFQSTLVLHAQSLGDLFKEQRDKETGEIASFADLIRVPPTQFTSFGAYNDQYFRIKVQLGWQIPTDSTDLIGKKLYDAIEASTITLFLTLTDHTIDLKDDGTATITVNYIGAIEGKMLAPETDILYVDSKISERLQQQERLLNSAKERLDRLKASNDKKGRHWTWDHGVFGDTRTGDELEEEGLTQEIEERLEAKSKITRENRAHSYKNFLTSLEKKGRIYYVDVDKQEIQNFQRLRDELAGLTNSTPEQLERIRANRLQQERLNNKPDRFTIESYKSTDPDNPSGSKGLSNSIDGIVAEKDEKFEKAINKENKHYTEAKQAKRHNKTRINFIYFGDIIEIALEIIRGEGNLETSEAVRNQKADIRKNFRFLLGPIELGDSEKTEIKNLSDIPISIDLFNAWFLKKVIRPQLDKYLLRDFLRDVCSELVVKAISSDPLGPYVTAVKDRISFSVFSLGSGDSDALAPGGNFGNTRLNLSSLESKAGELAKMRSRTDPTQLKHYFMIYVSGHSPHKLIGEYDKDIEKGIYHLFFGADKGIVKRISFSKVDMQYVKESRIVNQSKTKKGDIFFVEPYNAKVDLWGTSVFKPGMMLYIDPKTIGMPKSIPKNKRIPLGGYFTIIKVLGKIEPGKFETTIDLNWESSGEEADTSHYNQTQVSSTEKLIDSIDGQITTINGREAFV